MKKILIKIIKIYQAIPGSWHNYCRHIPTCSNYMIEAIETHGSIKGLYLGMIRVLKCNPLGTSGYDPVPLKGVTNMKKIKLLLLVIFTLTLSGCFKSDTMEDINIYTSIYPVKYIVDTLYGDQSKIHSIYPSGVNINDYKLTEKQIADYSKSDLFVFNSLDVEKEYAVEMINKNRDLKIIDVALGMEYTNKIEELWLDPYNYLMMAQNIRNGLDEYITNPYLIKGVDNKYDELKIVLSELDAELKDTATNSKSKTIVVDDDLFKFLTKYNINVISLEENSNLTAKTIADVKKMINNGTIKYIFTKNDSSNDTVSTLIEQTGVQLLKVNTMRSIDGGIQNSNQNYLTIMNENIDLFKKELYK